MACDTKILNDYGDGSLGSVTNPTGQINSYANVTAIGALGYQITIGTPSVGIYETFAVGKEIVIHVSAGNGTSTDATYLGAKLHCKITAVNGSVLTVDNDFTAVLPAASFTNYIVQAITVARFQSLTLSTGSITPPAFNLTNKYGGILVAKCTDTATFSGGSINLVDKGIPAASPAYRPLTAQEKSGTADTDKYAGWENHETLRKFLLNAGDGAVMIMAKHYVQTGTASRIGGTTAGAQFVRGNAGGSTIALVCGDMTGFDPSIISKTKGSGQGLGRCYIASNTKLRNDEGLYAYDVISNPARLKSLGIKGYGNGSFGNVINPTTPLNNYATVTAISNDGKTITYSNKTTDGQCAIGTGSMIMFHVSKHTDSSDMSLLGKFTLAKVLSDDGINSIVLDTSVTNIFDVSKLSKYNCQLISIPQIGSFTLSTSYTATTAYNTTTKNGGIFAIVCNGTCDITNGQINVEGKGAGTGYGSSGLEFIGNAQDCDILPLGAGGGSIFIISNTLTGNSSSRIGGSQDGTLFGGKGNSWDGSNVVNGGNGGSSGWKGASGSNVTGGSGAAGGDYGCVLSNAGSHLFIVANTINNLSIKNIVTGGKGSRTGWSTDGGSGYGGGSDSHNPWLSANGGYNGGAFGQEGQGGSSAWCFIYCNNYTNGSDIGVVV